MLQITQQNDRCITTVCDNNDSQLITKEHGGNNYKKVHPPLTLTVCDYKSWRNMLCKWGETKAQRFRNLVRKLMNNIYKWLENERAMSQGLVIKSK